MGSMYDDFLNFTIEELEGLGYSVNKNPSLTGCRGLLYARSELITTVGPIKFKNHFLFVDWDNDLFGRLDMLLETQKRFSKFVNLEYKVPHGWRLKLPNLAVIAISAQGFSQEAMDCAENRYFIPWAGGEVGQIMLLDLENNQFIHHYKKTYKQTGSIPLGYAVSEINSQFSKYLQSSRSSRMEKYS